MSEIDSSNELDRAIRTVKSAGYDVEASGPHRERMRHLHERAAGVSAQNREGRWMPAIPEPWFLNFGRTKCRCGEKFRGRRRYREHFALRHILGFDS